MSTEIKKEDQDILASSSTNDDDAIISNSKRRETKKQFFKKSKWYKDKNIWHIFVTAIMAIFTGWMAYETRKLALITSESINRADSSLRIAEKGIRISEQNFIIENRAWLAVESEPILMEDFANVVIGGVSKNSVLSVLIKNYGKTPADCVRIGHTISLNEKRNPVVFSTPIVIPPSKSEVIRIPVNISSNLILNQINEGKIKLYFYGIVIYNDIYNGKDTTEFMFQYNREPFGFLQKGFNRIK